MIVLPSHLSLCLTLLHTVEEKTDKKIAKVVAAVWGTEFIQFPAALQIYHQDILRKG